MFRKLIIAVAAVAAVATASIAVPATASAGWKGQHHGHHGFYGGNGFRVGFYAPSYAAYGSDCYVVRRVVYTPYGKRLRRVTVCN